MKIVLTGGTHSGKTSILKKLEEKGYTCYGEVAQSNMKMLIDALGMEEYRKWRTENFSMFQEMNIVSNLKREQSIENQNSTCFLDRGIFDWVASLKRENIEISEKIEQLVENISYDYIFIIEGGEHHNMRAETGRMLDQIVSEKWKKYIIEEYTQRFGEEKVIVVPFDELEKRVEFIESTLRKK